MGAQTSTVDEAKFNALQNKVNSVQSQISGFNDLKTKVNDISTAAASAIEYSKLAEAINKETAYRENLAKAIAKNPNELSVPLVVELSKSTAALQALNENLSKNTVFQDKVADTLSNNPTYKTRIRGEQGAAGNIGDKAALKSNLFDTGLTMWCADGELCELPKGKGGVKGSFEVGDGLRVKGNKILFNNHPDMNHGIQKRNGGGDFKDGPFIHGWGGGALGSYEGGEKVALNWDSNQNVYLPGGLYFGHGWEIRPNDSGLRFYKNGHQKFVLHNNGSPWADDTHYLMGQNKRYAAKFISNDNRHDGWVDMGKNRHGNKGENGTRIQFEEH